MQSGFGAVLVRITAMTVVWLLCAASLTFAGSRVLATDRPERSDPDPEPPKQEAKVRTLVVPDVRGQPYVFAKGMLEEGGFAWRVDGDVDGYAANLVVSQFPEPGATVVAEGTPTIILILERNPDYEERGSPENESPYDGTDAIVIGGTSPSANAAEPQDEAPAEPEKPKKKNTKPETTEQPGATQTEAVEPTSEVTEAAPSSEEPHSEPAPEPIDPKPESEENPSA